MGALSISSIPYVGYELLVLQAEVKGNDGQ